MGRLLYGEKDGEIDGKIDGKISGERGGKIARYKNSKIDRWKR